MKNETELTVRISADLLYKLEYVAEKEGRSLNNHILMLARNNIAYYERTHEKIPAPKPTQKQAEADKAEN